MSANRSATQLTVRLSHSCYSREENEMMLLVCAILMTTWPDDLKAKEAELEKERAVQVRLQELLQRARCDTRLAGQCLEMSSGKRESWIEESSPKRICTAFRKTWVLLQPTE